MRFGRFQAKPRKNNQEAIIGSRRNDILLHRGISSNNWTAKCGESQMSRQSLEIPKSDRTG